MNIPFPIIYPRLFCPDWFNSDRPYDEDAELTMMEQANERWLNSIGEKFMKRIPFHKPNPEPVEEAETDDDGNEDPEESEESQGLQDDLEEMPSTTTSSSIDDSPHTVSGEADSLTESLEDSSDDSPGADSPVTVSPVTVSPGEESRADTDDLEVEATRWPYEAQDD